MDENPLIGTWRFLPDCEQSYQDLTDVWREIPSFVTSTMRKRALPSIMRA